MHAWCTVHASRNSLQGDLPTKAFRRPSTVFRSSSRFVWPATMSPPDPVRAVARALLNLQEHVGSCEGLVRGAFRSLCPPDTSGLLFRGTSLGFVRIRTFGRARQKRLAGLARRARSLESSLEVRRLEVFDRSIRGLDSRGSAPDVPLPRQRSSPWL